MVPYFSLVLFKGIVRKQLTRKYTLKKRSLGCTEGALSGCTKAESLRTRWYVLSKTKTCGIITEVFHFYATCFVLCLLLRVLFKTVWELLHLHPKLIFRGALKKVPISFKAAYSLLPSFAGIIWEYTLNSHCSQKCNLSYTRKCTRNCSRKYIFYAISQKLH